MLPTLVQMIQQSRIPTSIPLQSTAPRENYSSSDSEDLPSFTSSPASSSPPTPPSSSSQDRPMTAGARKIQVSKPYEKEKSVSGSEANLPQAKGTRKAAKSAVEDQEEWEGSQDKQAISDRDSRTTHEEEDGQVGPSGLTESHDPQDRPAIDRVETLSVAEPAEPRSPSTSSGTHADADTLDIGTHSQSHQQLHQHPEQVLSPMGYILGFLQPTDPSKATSQSATIPPHPSSASSSPLSSSATQHSPASDSVAQDGSRPSVSAESASHYPQEKAERHEEEDRNGAAAHARSAAVRLLLGFMGALQASQYAVESFVTNLVQYYR